MAGWILFALFLLVGLGMLVAGMYYLHKERNDKDSAKLYRTVVVLGACLAVATVVVRFVTL